MEPIPDLDGAIQQLQYLQSGYWLAAGGAALLVYDWLLCLDREIQYVLKARWTFGKVWFICHRYAMMILAIGKVYGSMKSSNEMSSPEWCKMWDNLNYLATIIIVAAIQVTFALRVCALYRDSPHILTFLGATCIACPVFMLVFYAKVHSTMQYFPNTLMPYYGCVRTCNDCMRWFIYLYSPVMLLDVVILFFTLRQSFAARSQRNAAPILATLFRDGVLYFLVAFATALVNIVFNVFGPGAMKTWMVNYSAPLLSSMATRLLLNLHDQVSRNTHSTTDPWEGPTNTFSTIEFARPAVTSDAERVSYDMDGGGLSTDGSTRSGDRDDGGNTFEMKGLEEADREKSTRGPGWVESERALTVSGRRPSGVAKADPG